MTTKSKKPPPVIEIEEEEEALEQAAEETVTFKLSHFYSVLVVLAFAVGILVGYVAWGRDVHCHSRRSCRSSAAALGSSC